MLQKQSVNYNTTDQRKCMACSVRLTKIPTTTPSFRDIKKKHIWRMNSGPLLQYLLCCLHKSSDLVSELPRSVFALLFCPVGEFFIAIETLPVCRWSTTNSYHCVALKVVEVRVLNHANVYHDSGPVFKVISEIPSYLMPGAWRGSHYLCSRF